MNCLVTHMRSVSVVIYSFVQHSLSYIGFSVSDHSSCSIVYLYQLELVMTKMFVIVEFLKINS